MMNRIRLIIRQHLWNHLFKFALRLWSSILLDNVCLSIWDAVALRTSGINPWQDISWLSFCFTPRRLLYLLVQFNEIRYAWGNITRRQQVAVLLTLLLHHWRRLLWKFNCFCECAISIVFKVAMASRKHGAASALFVPAPSSETFAVWPWCYQPFFPATDRQVSEKNFKTFNRIYWSQGSYKPEVIEKHFWWHC